MLLHAVTDAADLVFLVLYRHEYPTNKTALLSTIRNDDPAKKPQPKSFCRPFVGDGLECIGSRDNLEDLFDSFVSTTLGEPIWKKDLPGRLSNPTACSASQVGQVTVMSLL